MAISRRRAVAALATGLVAVGARSSAGATDALLESASGTSRGPGFSNDGPDAEMYGRSEGYPVPPRAVAVRTGNPWPPQYRVGAFSHLDSIYPTHRVERASVPWRFKRSGVEIRYDAGARRTSLSDYVARHPVTGLLVAKDDTIVFEQYQYGRRDSDRLLGQSMTKSVTGILVGIAIAEGALKSVEDVPESYVAGFKGTEYGRTPIRDLLHMSSGVDFGEDRDDNRDLNRLWQSMVLGEAFVPSDTARSIAHFNRRVAPAGTRFQYASIEADVLSTVLSHALRRPLSHYLQEKVWQPIGAEADATWLVDAEGLEVGHFGFSGVLRDYARLGRLLANDGARDGRQIIARDWLDQATSVKSSERFLAPGRATPMLGYGYLLWLLPGPRRQVALIGQNGQRIFVDFASRLVMVQTALEDNRETWRAWSAVVEELS